MSVTAVRGERPNPEPAFARARARAGNAKDFLEFLEQLQPGTAAHLRATLPREVMSAVEGSARTDWNDIELDAQYVTAIVRWLGPERAREAWRKFTSERFIRAPAIRALAEGAIRVFGLSVPSFVRMVPFAFRQGFRDFADVEVTLGERNATVTIRNLAPAVSPEYATLFHGLFLGIYDIAGVPPQLEFRPALDARRITAQFRW